MTAVGIVFHFRLAPIQHQMRLPGISFLRITESGRGGKSQVFNKPAHELFCFEQYSEASAAIIALLNSPDIKTPCLSC